jgi:hypothetical protein
MNLRVYKMLQNFLVAAQLAASQEGLSSMVYAESIAEYLTESMELRPSCEAASCAATQTFPNIL